MSSPPSPKAGTGCLGLFGAIFVVAGLVPGGMGLLMLFNAWQASSWLPTPATLTQVQLESARSDDGGATYSLSGSFRYEFDGQRYVSDQIDFSVGSDNIGDFHQNSYSLLRPSLNIENGVTAYINPEHPQEAVLLREIRWGMVLFLMLFLAVFGGVGLSIMGVCVVGMKKRQAEKRLQEAHPQEPWRWQPAWEHGEIHCSGRSRMWIAVSMAVFWNLISSSVWLFLPSELANGNYVALVALLFPLAGLGLAAYAALTVARWRRYGRTTLILPEVPLRLGSRLNGYLRASQTLAARQVALTLSCVEIRGSDSGKNRSTDRSILYQDETTATVQPAADHLQVPISFALPVDQPPSDVSNPRRKVQWQLEATASVAGPDLNVCFDLPVFEADLLSPLSNLGQVGEHAQSPDQPLLSKSEGTGDPGATGVDMHYRGGGLRYYFPPARHLAIGAGFTGAGLVSSGAALGGSLTGKLPFMGVVTCGLLGGVFILVGLNELLMRSELRTRVGQLSVRRGWWLGADRYYRLDEIESLTIEDGMQAGDKRFYQLVLKTRKGKKQVLAGGLQGRRNTLALRDLIADAVGIESS